MYIGLAEALEDVATCSRGVNMQELQALTVTWVAQETEAYVERIDHGGCIVVDVHTTTRSCIMMTVRESHHSVCGLLKTHSIEQFAGPSGVAATVKVVQLATLYAKALEHSHQMRMSHVVWRVLWPALEGVLSRARRKHSEDVEKQVLADIAKVTAPVCRSDGVAMH